MSVHVDDIKLCGERTIMEQTIRKLESHFDALKLEKENFLHLGLQHTTLKDGSISVSQTHYINELREIPEDKLKLQDKQEPADDEFKQYFMSLLGGLAWCVQTRIDIAIFVGALQRKLQNPSVEDVLNLNRVLRYVKVKPLAMHFKRINNPWRLVAISDSGFKGEGQDHLAIRSGIIALVGKEFPKLGVNDIQIIEYISKKQTRICRSTYSAELFSCLDVCGLAQNVSMAITDILQGTMTATALSDTLEAGKLALELDVVIDAAAVYENLIVEETKLKTPSDVGMLIHALKMKELLKRIIKFLDSSGLILDRCLLTVWTRDPSVVMLWDEQLDMANGKCRTTTRFIKNHFRSAHLNKHQTQSLAILNLSSEVKHPNTSYMSHTIMYASWWPLKSRDDLL